MKTNKMIILFISICLLSGCASIMRGSDQQVTVNAYDAKTGDIVSANCVLSNDAGVFRTRSNRSVIVGRDKNYLTIDCETDSMSGRTVVDGKVNIGYVAVDFFLIDLCLISCWVDGLSGSWSEYQSMIDVPMDPKR